MSNTHRGGCFCGTVKYELSGDPQAMGYCHCESCRAWSGDPIHAWTIWGEDTVKITAGEDSLATFHKSPDSLSFRQFCSKCGGHLMISHPALGVYDVFPGTVPELEFEAAMHINCTEAVMALADALPKFKDFPSEYEAFGGTGEMMP